MNAALLAGRPFFKMTGSGNDFVVVDARRESGDSLVRPEVIQSLCSRGTGVGADGLVLLEPPGPGGDRVDFAMRYFNSDGSRAALCGNASLCTTALAVRLGAGRASGLRFRTDSGVIEARLDDGLPEIDLQPVRTVTAEVTGVALEGGERRVGYARAGVPHVVVLCDDVEAVDVGGRGALLRRHPFTLPDGANVNFVSPGPGAGAPWSIRTFERGVEGETLACGTGAVATAILLVVWELADPSRVELRTRSGRTLGVRLSSREDAWHPSLRGEGRLVFEGVLREV